MISSVGQRTRPEKREAQEPAAAWWNRVRSSTVSLPVSQATTCWVWPNAVKRTLFSLT